MQLSIPTRKLNMSKGVVSAFSHFTNIFAEPYVVVARCNPFGRDERPCKLEYHDIVSQAQAKTIVLSNPPSPPSDPKKKKGKPPKRMSKKQKKKNKKGKFDKKGKQALQDLGTAKGALRMPAGVANYYCFLCTLMKGSASVRQQVFSSLKSLKARKSVKIVPVALASTPN